MSKKFVRKIIGVKSIQDLRDYTNEVGDIILKDGIHGYLRTEDEYKPITYPIIWDYGTGKGHESRSDMHVNAKGIHKLDTKNDTSHSYDLEDQKITTTSKIKKENGVAQVDDTMTSNSIKHNAKIDDSSIDEELNSTNYIKTTTVKKVAINYVADKADFFVVGKTSITYNNYGKSVDSNTQAEIIHHSLITQAASSNYNHASSYWLNMGNGVTSNLGMGSVARHQIEITDNRMYEELVHEHRSEFNVFYSNRFHNGVQISAEEANDGVILFKANDKIIKFEANYNDANNDYQFTISGDSELVTKFRDEIDALLGFTTTINGLKQRISSLESRVTSLENR